MNLDFLDNGLPVEPIDFEKASNEIRKFKEFCKNVNKTPGQLSEKDLQKYYTTCDNGTC